MDIKTIETKLEKFRQLPVIEHEKTVFDIGVRGYYENPTTEVLSFFCNGEEQHGMDNLVANSFVALINKKSSRNIPNASNAVIAEREVSTKNSKRIDLLLDTGSHLIAIEAKVGHVQNNPFQEYKSYVDTRAKYEGKEAVYIVLSSRGKVDDVAINEGWIGISFLELSDYIKSGLQQFFIDKPFNKWMLVMKDFLLHMEHLMSDSKINEEQTSFALTNLKDISKAWQLVINTLEQCNNDIIHSFHVENGLKVKSQKATWFAPLPAYIFSIPSSDIEVVLFASPTPMKGNKSGKNEKNTDQHLYLQVHVSKKNTDNLYSLIKESVTKCTVNAWDDVKTGFLRWPLTTLTTPAIKKEVIDTLTTTYIVEQELKVK